MAIGERSTALHSKSLDLLLMDKALMVSGGGLVGTALRFGKSSDTPCSSVSNFVIVSIDEGYVRSLLSSSICFSYVSRTHALQSTCPNPLAGNSTDSE